jgi:hypothetical protein
MWGLMKSSSVGIVFALLLIASKSSQAQGTLRNLEFTSPTSDSSQETTGDTGNEQQELRNAWGIDILISNGGFGLGGFYRREFSDEWFGFTSLSVSESKDEREVEQFDLYTNTSYVPGKLNRFLVLPLTFGIQHRLFKDEITENFRPYINAGAGPTMIYVTPFTEITNNGIILQFQQVEFFKALGRGQPHYTLGGFIGFGANFGTEKSNLFGVNFRYYFTYLLGKGLPSLYNLRTGDVSATKKDFGGFFITLNVGMAY